MNREWARVSPPEQKLIRSAQEKIPVKLSSLAKELGLRVISSTLPPGISGEIRPGGDGFMISVNRHDSARRQRFTVAHEIAHFLIHRDQIGNGISDDVLYRSSLSDAREAEANRLAAEILVPRSTLETKRDELSNLGDEELVASLSSLFEVSEAAMRIRLSLL
jgi:Zn-dependent peptidase ImmA (M78 family)